MTGAEQLELAEKAYLAQDYGGAVEHARAALSAGLDLNVPGSERGEYWEHPETAQCEILLGTALLELGDKDAALEHLDRAVSLDRENKRTYANRGHVRRERGELTEALADLDYALRRDPGYAFARFRRAQTLLALERRDEAEAELCTLLTANPYDAAPFALWQQLRSDRGLPSERASLPSPSDYLSLFQRAAIFMQHEEPKLALADYDAAYALSPQGFILASRSVAHEKLGKLGAAIADAEAYLATDPNHAGMKGWRDSLVQRSKDTGGAR